MDRLQQQLGGGGFAEFFSLKKGQADTDQTEQADEIDPMKKPRRYVPNAVDLQMITRLILHVRPLLMTNVYRAVRLQRPAFQAGIRFVRYPAELIINGYDGGG
jgi:hypothetical protein